ncbi:hypothetical protein [Nocardia camponoti]|uniref:Uncharacterized protein n=1 Tax=Nocardia camponoti TaxID=1616106 RepID=A0A917QJ07_9NOCA|nr:hypothetical protein [Nocardia camponoti]GGK51259.1 hypothetical protein GCM10011591_23560 [Nocardia camponoti]
MRILGKPFGSGYITFKSADDGGRQTGRPTGPVYGANARVVGAAPGTFSELVSMLIELPGTVTDGRELVRFGFIAPEIVAPSLYPGAVISVSEGPVKVVADLTVAEIYGDVAVESD